MIMREGISSLLKGFSSPIKDAFRISHLEFGNDDGGEIPPVPIGINTPLNQFRLVHRHLLQPSDFSVSDYKTLKLSLSLNGTDVLGENSEGVLEFSSIRLVCSSGEVFAWRRFEHSILVGGYITDIEWDVVLDEFCWNKIPRPEVEYPYVRVRMQGYERDDWEDYEDYVVNNWEDYDGEALEYFDGRGFSVDGKNWDRDPSAIIPEYGDYSVYIDMGNTQGQWNTDKYDGGGIFAWWARILELMSGGGYLCLGLGWYDEPWRLYPPNNTGIPLCESYPYPYVKLLMQGHEEGDEYNNWEDFRNGDDATENFVGRGYSADGITWSRDSTDFIPKYGEYTIYTDLQNGDFMWNTDTYEGGGFFMDPAHIVEIADGRGYDCLGHGWRYDTYLAIERENYTSMRMCNNHPM